MMHLLHLTLAHPVGRRADPAAGKRRFQRRREMKRMREEIVAQEHGRLVAPLGVDRRCMPADHRFVEHVVVHERGGVNHLDHRREHGVVLR